MLTILKLDVQDGLGLIEVAVAERHFDAERLIKFFEEAHKAFAAIDADAEAQHIEELNRGYAQDRM